MPPELLEAIGQLQDELEKLKSAAEEIKRAGSFASESTIASQSVINTSKALLEPTQKLVDKIEKIDFPIRLDKLDSAVTSINLGIQNTQARIESVEKNITTKLDTISKYVAETNNHQQAQLKLIKLICIISVLLNCVILYLLFR